MKQTLVFVPHATLVTLGMPLQENVLLVVQPIVIVVLEPLALAVKMVTDMLEVLVRNATMLPNAKHVLMMLQFVPHAHLDSILMGVNV